MAFAILGFAVLHAITRGMSSRAVVLAGVYVATLVLGWPVLAMSILGLAEAALQHSRSRRTKARTAELADLMNPNASTDGDTTMEVILLERVAKLGQMGDVVRVKDGFARNFLLAQGQGAARHQGEPLALREHEGRARSAQPRAKGRSGKDRPEARRPELHGAAPGGRRRPALRLGLAARSRRAGHARRALRSVAPRSRSIRRSRRSDCTRCRSRCIPKSR